MNVATLLHGELVNIIPVSANCFSLLDIYHISLNIERKYFLLMERGVCQSSRICKNSEYLCKNVTHLVKQSRRRCSHACGKCISLGTLIHEMKLYCLCC